MSVSECPRFSDGGGIGKRASFSSSNFLHDVPEKHDCGLDIKSVMSHMSVFRRSLWRNSAVGNVK